LLDFDISTAKSALINIGVLQSILDLILLNLALLDPSSLVSFCKEVVDAKGKDSCKRAAMFIMLLIEICKGEDVFAQFSTNMHCVKGVRVERDKGMDQVWTITKASFERETIPILSAIVKCIDNDVAKRIAPLLEGKKRVKEIVTELDGIKIVAVASRSAYFVLKRGEIQLPDDGSNALSFLNFNYQAFSKEDVPVGDLRNISWLCSADQMVYVGLFMKTLGESGLRGDVVDSCSLDYVIKMCNVLHKCIDPFKLNACIDKINGIRADDGGEDKDEGVDGETQEDGSDPITPFELCRMFKQDIDGELEPIRYDFEKKPVGPKNSTRMKNGLATVAQVCTTLTSKSGWLKPQGSHYNAEYSRFLATKVATEVKSFLGNGRSLFRYPPSLTS